LQNTHGLYNFSNIRYAAPPLGDLRFRAPVWPEPNRTHVQDGSVGRVCPQANPLWEEYIEPAFLLSLESGTSFNQSTNISSYPYVPQKMDPRTTEDCLFLDVIVPKKIFDRAQNKTFVSKKTLAPVLVWIYGGGYVEGDKSSYNPTGLIHESKGGDGILYVAMNYRVSFETFGD
jgi:carboxylesterase type B